jgi:hypothetical protein
LISESNSTSTTTLYLSETSQQPSILPVSSLSTNFEPREPPDLSSHDQINRECSSSWHQPVSNSSTDVLNFEISTCLPCQTAESHQFQNFLGRVSSPPCHNIQISKVCKMEVDCNETDGGVSSPSMQDLTTLLNSWSSQILSQNAQLLNDIHHVVATTASFKQEIRSKLDDLRALVDELKASSLTSSSPVHSSQHQVSSVQVTSTPDPVVSTVQSMGTHLDQQSQMMQLFAASVAKLLTALSKKSESKSDWPKFSGDYKKFRAWHLSIL